MGEDIDFESAGYLDGLDGAARDQRLELLRELVRRGFTREELDSHHRAGTLAFLPTERAIAGEARHTLEETIAAVGIAPELFIALRQSIGLPQPEVPADARIYTDADIAATNLAMAGRAAGLSDEDVLDVARVVGRGMQQVASTLRDVALRRVLEPNLTELEFARRLEEFASRLAPAMRELVAHILESHVLRAAEFEATGAAERLEGRLPDSHEVAICFADMVGFTRMGEEVTPDELGRLASRLEAVARTIVKPPVTLVKTIGDAVMLVAPEPTELVLSALELLHAADSDGPDGLPQLRAGIATGNAQRRAGDWFGQPVNVASRVTSIARAGSVLATGPVRDAAGDAARWSYVGERRLRGVRDPVALYRARPLRG